MTTLFMIKNLLFVFWFFLPTGIANIGAFLSSKIPVIKNFNYPLDFYLRFKNKRVFDNHKTIRGLLCGIIIAIIVVYLQIFAYNHINTARHLPGVHSATWEESLINYSAINPLILGFLAGFGALTGDAVKSFFKRQKNIPPGKSWIPFDEIDYIIGGIIFTAFYIRLTLQQYLLAILLFFLLHFIINYVGYFLKLKKEKL